MACVAELHMENPDSHSLVCATHFASRWSARCSKDSYKVIDLGSVTCAIAASSRNKKGGTCLINSGIIIMLISSVSEFLYHTSV